MSENMTPAERDLDERVHEDMVRRLRYAKDVELITELTSRGYLVTWVSA